MNRQEIIDYCLTFPATYEDYPFSKLNGDDTAVMRHWANKRSFALIINHHGKLYLNLKCDPLEAGLLRKAFEGVLPGWHMNKEHWNSVMIGTDVPESEIKRQIENSYHLTRPKTEPKNEKRTTTYEKQ